MKSESKQWVLINASAAKYGGAREILRQYIKYLSVTTRSSRVNYLVLCPNPNEFRDLRVSGLRYIECETTGITTLLYSLLGVGKVIKRLHPKRVISFNNINYVGKFKKKRVTYFHQEKAISSYSPRMLAIRIALRWGTHTKLVVQTERIRRRLIEEVGIAADLVDVQWPGVRRLESISNTAWSNSRLPQELLTKRLALLPVYNAKADHKDFDFWFKIKRALNEIGYTTVSLCETDSLIADFNVGRLQQKELDLLYRKSDLLVLISKQETLCLPLFEFAQSTGLVIAMDAPYIQEFCFEMPWLERRTLILSKEFDLENTAIRDFLRDRPFDIDFNFTDEYFLGNWNL